MGRFLAIALGFVLLCGFAQHSWAWALASLCAGDLHSWVDNAKSSQGTSTFSCRGGFTQVCHGLCHPSIGNGQAGLSTRSVSVH